MNDATFVPASLQAESPKVEVWDNRHRVLASLAGYSLKPGKSYQIRVYYPGRDASTWRLKTVHSLPATIAPLPDKNDGTADFQVFAFRVPVWPENFFKSLAVAAADVDLAIEFQDEDRPSQRLKVKMCLKPSVYALCSVLLPILIYFSNLLNNQSQTLADFLSERFDIILEPWLVSIGLSVLIWVFVLVVYLWWKSRRQPSVRAARHLHEFRSAIGL